MQNFRKATCQQLLDFLILFGNGSGFRSRIAAEDCLDFLGSKTCSHCNFEKREKRTVALRQDAAHPSSSEDKKSGSI